MLKPNKIITGLAAILVLGTASCQKIPSKEVSQHYTAKQYVRNNFSVNAFSDSYNDNINVFLDKAVELVDNGEYQFAIEMFKVGISKLVSDAEDKKRDITNYLNYSKRNPSSKKRFTEQDTTWTGLISKLDYSLPDKDSFLAWRYAIDQLYKNDEKKRILEQDFCLRCSKIIDSGIKYQDYIDSLIELEKRLGNFNIVPDSLDLSNPVGSLETFKKQLARQNLRTAALCVADRTPILYDILTKIKTEQFRDRNMQPPPTLDWKISSKEFYVSDGDSCAKIEFNITEYGKIKEDEKSGWCVFKKYGNKWLLEFRQSEF